MRLGIDPGLDGALSLISGAQLIRCWDMPTDSRTVKQVGKKDTIRRRVNSAKLHDLLLMIDDEYQPKIFVEEVRFMGGNNGGLANFSMGESMQAIRSAIDIAALKAVYIAPNSWKIKAGLRGKDKNAAIDLCKEMFRCGDWLNRKKDHNRAEAALIAQFGD